MRNTLLLLFFTLLAPTLFAQKYSNEFLGIGVSARSQAMGNAQVATVSDVTAGFWNPAGLMSIDPSGRTVQLSFTHSEWFAGIANYDYFGIATPLAPKSPEVKVKEVNSAVGFSFVRLGIDNIPNTLSLYEDDGTLNYNNITPFSSADYAFIFSYARNLFNKPATKESGLKNLDVGVNAKIIHHKIGPFASAWGFGLDVGVQYKMGGLRLGLMGKDITSTFNAWNFNFTDDEKETLQITGNEIPESSLEITRPQLVLGLAYDKRLYFGGEKTSKKEKTKNRQFLQFAGEVDMALTFDGKRNTLVSAPVSLDPSLGIELGYSDLIFLRGGLNNFQQATDESGASYWSMQPNVGLGVKLFDALRIDYAYPMGKQALTENSHTISLILDMDIPRLIEIMRREA